MPPVTTMLDHSFITLSYCHETRVTPALYCHPPVMAIGLRRSALQISTEHRDIQEKRGTAALAARCSRVKVHIACHGVLLRSYTTSFHSFICF